MANQFFDPSFRGAGSPGSPGVGSTQRGLQQVELGKQAIQQNQFNLGQDKENARLTSVLNAAVDLNNLPDDSSKLDYLLKRKEQLNASGTDTQDTDEMINLYQSGRGEEANALIGSSVNAGIQKGFLTAPAAGPSAFEQAKTAQVERQTELLGTEKPISPLDQAKIDKIRKEIELNPESDDLKRQEFELRKQIEQRQATKLSAGLEKALIDSQDRVVEAQRNSSEFDILADQVEATDLAGGIQSSTNETFKALLGTQDDVTEFRRRFNSVRLSEGLKNLPPGPATDKDMEQAFKGVPPENAPASQIASFLRGAAKMARFDAGYNQFKADFISEKSTSKGMNKEWRRTVQSPVLERSITIAEIYAEAAAEGMTPEDVKAELGIE